MLFNPATTDFDSLDPRSREIMNATVEFFETKGLARLKDDGHERRWCGDFLDVVKEKRIFSTLLTPPEHAIDDPDARWDTQRNCVFNEMFRVF